MVSIYDCTEPTVISEELLLKAVEDQRPEGEAGRIALQDGIKFPDVKILVLSFRNILQIENLWNFNSLQRLNLDNNLIEKIEGLDSLVSLKWLDLSFNNIEVISGLNNLTNLEDLSLFNNHIQKLENLEHLQKLQVLSVGNNNMEDLENLMLVRRMPNVKTLNVQGNPLCSNKNYRMYVGAFLPEVVYLDYKLLDEDTKTKGIEIYCIRVEAIMAKDKGLQQKMAEQRVLDERNKLHAEACVTYLYSSVLFDSLLANDHDVALCLSLEGADRFLSQFKDNMLSTCKEAFDTALADYYKRKEEVDEFTHAIGNADSENLAKAVKMTDRFSADRGKFVRELKRAAQQEEVNYSWMTTLTTDHHQAINSVGHKLMENELYLSDQMEEQIKEFERMLLEMTQNSIESIRNVATVLRDQETRFHEQLADISLFFMDRVMKDEEALPLRMKDLFTDKDTVLTALHGSHDARTIKIDRVEDKIALGIKAWTDNVLESMRNHEINRNRKRILEITHFVDCQTADVEEFERNVKDEIESIREILE